MLGFHPQETRDWFARKGAGARAARYRHGRLDGRFRRIFADRRGFVRWQRPDGNAQLWPVLWAEVNARSREISRGKTGEVVFFMRSAFGRSGRIALCFVGGRPVGRFHPPRRDRHGHHRHAFGGLVGNAYSHSTVAATSLLGHVRSAELMQRWCEMAAFAPVMRSHEGNRPTRTCNTTAPRTRSPALPDGSRVHAHLAPCPSAAGDEAVATGAAGAAPAVPALSLMTRPFSRCRISSSTAPTRWSRRSSRRGDDARGGAAGRRRLIDVGAAVLPAGTHFAAPLAARRSSTAPARPHAALFAGSPKALADERRGLHPHPLEHPRRRRARRVAVKPSAGCSTATPMSAPKCASGSRKRRCARDFRPSVAARILRRQNEPGRADHDNHSPYYVPDPGRLLGGVYKERASACSPSRSMSPTRRWANRCAASLPKPMSTGLSCLAGHRLRGGAEGARRADIPFVRISPGTNHALTSSVFMDDAGRQTT